MSDDLQQGINEACSYFYGNCEHIEQVIHASETKLPVRDMNVLLMLGIGYLLAKGYLRYRGDQYYLVNISGFDYYKSLLENGDIVP